MTFPVSAQKHQALVEYIETMKQMRDHIADILSTEYNVRRDYVESVRRPYIRKGLRQRQAGKRLARLEES